MPDGQPFVVQPGSGVYDISSKVARSSSRRHESDRECYRARFTTRTLRPIVRADAMAGGRFVLMSATAPTTSAPSLASRLSAPLGNARRLRYAGSRPASAVPIRNGGAGELAGLLPASWRALFAEGQARVLYVVTGRRRAGACGWRRVPRRRDRPTVALDEDADPWTAPGADRASAQVGARLGSNRAERPRWLLLPGGQVLRRRILLPAAATERLREVVAHELDRQTPFRADQVAYDCRVLSIDAASKMAQVELLVLPREKLEAALVAARAAGGPLERGGCARCSQGRPLRLQPVAARAPPSARSSLAVAQSRTGRRLR